MAKPAELGNAQEAFALALEQSRAAVTAMREKTRPLTPVPKTRKNPDIQVSVTGTADDFQAILQLINHLRKIEDSAFGEIVCVDEDSDFSNGNGRLTSQGLQSFWTRAGKKAPTVRYTSDSLEQVMGENPVAILLRPGNAPETVRGYIRVDLTEPHVTLLLRRDQ